MTVGRLCWEAWWQRPVHSLVWAAPAKRDVAGSRRRVALARGWLDLSTDTGWQSALYRDMAEYATAAGDTVAALDWAGRAHTLAQDQDDPRVLHLAGHVWGRALLAAGRPGEGWRFCPRTSTPGRNSSCGTRATGWRHGWRYRIARVRRRSWGTPLRCAANTTCPSGCPAS